MASKVRDNVIREDAAAECKSEAVKRVRFKAPITEVIMPITPARRAKMINKPVAMFPIGKYMGNIRAGVVRTDATTQNADQGQESALVDKTNRNISSK